MHSLKSTRTVGCLSSSLGAQGHLASVSTRRVAAARHAPLLSGCLDAQAWTSQQGTTHRILCASGGAELATVATSVASQDQEEGGADDPSPMDYGYCSAQGVRDTMEDEVQVHFNGDGQYLYASVFDGHGGDEAAQWLSSNLHIQLDQCIRGMCDADEPCSIDTIARPPGVTEKLVKGFARADKMLIDHLRQGTSEMGPQAGATATVAIVKEGRLFVANVGDSQAVLCRRGAAVAIAHTHRVYGQGADVVSETERVMATGGWVDDGRVCGVLAVSRAFGDWEFKGDGLPSLLSNGITKGYWDAEFAGQQAFSSDPVVVTPDVTETVLSPEDEFVIVASDGLWDVMQPREAIIWARKEFKAKSSAKKVAEGLTSLALRRYSTDNVAVVVVDLQGPSYWSEKPKKAAKKPLFGGMFGGK